VITDAFQYLQCVPAGSTKVVLSQPALDCHSDAYISGRRIMIASLLAWVFVLPLLVFWLVYRFQRRGLLQAKDVSQRWGFLYRTFRPRYYWFEVLLLGRRVVIVCLAVLLTAEPDVRTGSLVGALAGFLTLQVWLRPWVHSTANYWEMVSLVALLLECALATGHSIVHDGAYSPATQVLASLLVFCVSLSLFVAVLRNACTRSKWLDRVIAPILERYNQQLVDRADGASFNSGFPLTSAQAGAELTSVSSFAKSDLDTDSASWAGLLSQNTRAPDQAVTSEWQAHRASRDLDSYVHPPRLSATADLGSRFVEDGSAHAAAAGHGSDLGNTSAVYHRLAE